MDKIQKDNLALLRAQNNQVSTPAASENSQGSSVASGQNSSTSALAGVEKKEDP
jgi:hypothetical protein